MTAWHVAADCSKLDSLQKVWEWSKENLTIGVLSNKLLITQTIREILPGTWQQSANN
jgi:hypothetical protein